MNEIHINEKRMFCPESSEELISFALDRKGLLIAINGEKIINNDLQLKNIINSNIGYPDGELPKLYAYIKNRIHTPKIPGCELWLDIIKKYHDTKTFALIGGSEHVITQTKLQLEEDFPHIKISYVRNGYFKDEEQVALNKIIMERKPDIIFVAMGSPKQELLMQQMFQKYNALYMGLGGSFDIYVKAKKRAPNLFIKLKLEWFYRLIREPKRFKRQLKLIKFFVFLK